MGQRTLKRNLEILQLDENEKTTHQNLRNAMKAGLRGKFIAFSIWIRKGERTKIDTLDSSLEH